MADIRNIWGGSFEVDSLVQSNDDDDGDYDRSAYRSSPSEDEVKQGWLLRPYKESNKGKKRKACMNVKVVLRILLVIAVLAGFVTIVVVVVNSHRHHHPVTGPDNYTVALQKALMFFNAQRSGRLPKQNNVSWRGDSCLKDEIVGGYYDAGNAVKFSFPTSFAMTILSWSVIEYSAKYETAGELDHVRDIIKWGTDYLLKTFKSSDDSIGSVAAQVGGRHDQDCWMRPEDLDSDKSYTRDATQCNNCPALAAEMASALAAASIVFRDTEDYSKKLVQGAEMLFKFATKDQGAKYSSGPDPASSFYNSSGFWDEFVWGGAWLYCATGNSSYLQLVTTPDLADKDYAFWGGPDHGVFSWDNKHTGAQLLLSRMRIYLGYGYPYEEMLSTFQKQVENIMCSYITAFPAFNRTKGGLIQLNQGRPQPLQYVVNAAFLATLFSDYLEGKLIPGWHCGSQFYSIEALRDFARSQIDYILGKNPQRMSYVVGFGDHFPKRVHHRGASIPHDNVKYGCKGGLAWRDGQKPNPNTIVGAMVAGPDQWDGFQDIRSNYNYTEPTIAGNAGLVAALVGLSGGRTSTIDRNTIFYAIPPLYTYEPPPPAAPWTP